MRNHIYICTYVFVCVHGRLGGSNRSHEAKAPGSEAVPLVLLPFRVVPGAWLCSGFVRAGPEGARRALSSADSAFPASWSSSPHFRQQTDVSLRCSCFQFL